MEYVYWTIGVLVVLYFVVRLVFGEILKKERYKG
jgi:hypothetical protein